MKLRPFRGYRIRQVTAILVALKHSKSRHVLLMEKNHKSCRKITSIAAFCFVTTSNKIFIEIFYDCGTPSALN